MAHRLIAGSTGSGKSTYAIQEALKLVDQGVSLTLAAPHENFGEDFISELYARYGKAILRRLIVIDIRDTDKVIMQRYIHASTDPNPFERMLENDLFAEAFMDTVSRRRTDISDMAEKPVLEKYTKFAARVAQNQDQWFPEFWIPYMFVPSHACHKYFCDHLTDPELKRELLAFKSFPMREQLSILDPIFRLLSGVLGSPAVILRTTKPVTWDKKAHHDNGGITVILGGKADEASSVIIGSDFQESMTLAKQGLKRPLVYICDETLNFRLFGKFESRIVSTIRKKNVSRWDCVQSLDYPTDEIRDNHLQNSDHVWMRQGTRGMAKEAAEDLLGALNEYKVHHTDQVKRLIPTQRAITKKTKGISKNHDGHETHTENESEAFETIYREEIENKDVYQSPADQLIWLAQKVQQLPVGTCWVREAGRAPYELAVKFLPDSWGFPGLKERKVAECLNLLKQSAIHEVPEIRWPEPPKKGPTTKGGGSVMKPS